ncbi:MAG: hypothetical protein P1U40_09860 [Coxiellaceae bacterium]|nr:hypothetical protein [Coxiellaceae bacterium]
MEYDDGEESFEVKIGSLASIRPLLLQINREDRAVHHTSDQVKLEKFYIKMSVTTGYDKKLKLNDESNYATWQGLNEVFLDTIAKEGSLSESSADMQIDTSEIIQVVALVKGLEKAYDREDYKAVTQINNQLEKIIERFTDIVTNIMRFAGGEKSAIHDQARVIVGSISGVINHVKTVMDDLQKNNIGKIAKHCLNGLDMAMSALTAERDAARVDNLRM